MERAVKSVLTCGIGYFTSELADGDEYFRAAVCRKLAHLAVKGDSSFTKLKHIAEKRNAPAGALPSTPRLALTEVGLAL